MGSYTNRFFCLIIFIIILFNSQSLVFAQETNTSDGCNPTEIITNEGILDRKCRTDSFIDLGLERPTLLEIEGNSSEDSVRYVIIRDVLNERLFPLIIIVSVIMLVYAGLRMVLSLGKDDEFNKARDFALYTLYGFLVVIFAYGIVAVVLRIIVQNFTPS